MMKICVSLFMFALEVCKRKNSPVISVIFMTLSMLLWPPFSFFACYQLLWVFPPTSSLSIWSFWESI